jgi:membrane protein YqaA with SNARE-associated domain
MESTTALWGALVVGLLTGLAPVGTAEATALAVGALPSWPIRAATLGVFTLGHVVGKMLWFWAGTCESRVTWPWLRRGLDRARAVATAHPTLGTTVMFTSAVASLPPFQLMASAAGMVGTRWTTFFLIALAGRLIRFSAIASVPALFGLS